MEKEKKYYLLLTGVDSCHDMDEWLGIYESISELHMAYELAVRETELDPGIRLMIYAFMKGKSGSHQEYMEVAPEDLW